MTSYSYQNYVEDDFTDETAEEAEAREALASRGTLIANLREYATMLEDHPALPAPTSVYMSAWCTAEQARAGRRGIPGWRKHNTEASYTVQYAKTIGTGGDYRSDIQLALEVSKEGSCERVQVGTEHVEAVEAHERPIYRWSCPSGPGNDEVQE